MRMLLITCVAVAAGATTFAGQAAADPPPPNLDGYTAVEATAFETYSAYATSGVQFLTPDGLHCRITANSRATGVDGACWGKLPGVSGDENLATVSLTTSTASLTHMPDLGQQEIVARPDASPAGPAAIDPSMYRPLSPGQKITYGLKATDKVITCAVSEQHETTCVLPNNFTGSGPHGFVLSPTGSRAF
ncbi:Uncharacterised protein [Mycobacteroides abscessus subsp. bolletii]|uniref:hypothetical protein n=1 Tax=Mycobacteroides abscessus TaxID=36809 RepID=UPI0009A812B2|nr:hypothetical protein [Mycobacteroides abscessus]SKG55590.1 Uncharacterised protein [Mycobacteroides abscessus subsp. bolletii]SKU59811.1 Uncharacterised protein [Mycobacteroides abscessus subsp. bolletii]SLF01286.1 Uncharacterised protein [Mycobacteroides abscessus subsp. bolletii]